MSLPIDVFIPSGTGEKYAHYTPLLTRAKVENKGDIKIGDDIMLNYVLKAVDEASSVRSITLGGYPQDKVTLTLKKPIHFIEGGKTSFETYYEAAKFFKSKGVTNFMAISGDIPLITGEMIDRALSAVDFTVPFDVIHNIIWDKDKMRVYPDAHKLPITLKEGKILSGDFTIFTPEVFERHHTVIGQLMGNRKSVFAFIRIISFRYILLYKFRRLSLRHIFSRIEKIFNIKGAFWVTEFPEPAIDLDYEDDLERFPGYIKSKPRDIGSEQSYLITAANVHQFKQIRG